MMNPPACANREKVGVFRGPGGRKPSLTLSFAAFSIFVCLLATGLCIVDLIHARNVAVGVARREAENVTRSLAQQAEDTFDSATGALRTLAERAELNGTGPAERTILHNTMIALITTEPRIHNLIIVDESGRYVVSNLPATRAQLPAVADRPYFRYHRSHPGSGVYISGPAISKTDTSWVLFATRRLNHADGRFAGVVIDPISMVYFERNFAGVDVGRSGTIALVAADGTIVVRRPREFIGGSFFHNVGMFSDQYKSFIGGSYIGASPVDGVRRLVAFERLARYPLTMAVGLAENDYLAAWRADALANYAALALGTALIGALASGLGAQITKRKRAESALARSSADALTGLANRRRFDAELAREWGRAAQDQTPLALLMIEVGNLKAYNDRYGREEGDELLTSIARALSEALPPSNFAARYSGLEFAVILPAIDEPTALIIAERIRPAIRGLVDRHSDTPGAMVLVTFGVASLVPESSTGPSTIVGAVFVALHGAKHKAAGDVPALLAVDALTGLANRRRFDTELEREWCRAARDRAPVGLLVVEVDNLKAYNDRYGRELGDELLMSIARAVSAAIVSPSSLAARYSGLEFAVLLPRTDEAHSLIVAEHLRLAVRTLVGQGLAARRTGTTVTVSLGTAALTPESSDEPTKLVGAAFIALHNSKRDGSVAASYDRGN